jgi:hypothetical protein
MSYYTNVEFQFSDEPPPFNEVEECARAHLESIGYAVDDILEDLQRGWEEGKAEFSDLVCEDIEGLLCRVSTKFPQLRIYSRGGGEEPRDFWLREFEGGKVVFSVGPFHEAEA